MNETELLKMLNELIRQTIETEWIEFKHNNYKPEDIGEYISALSNSACLHKKQYGYLVFGVENETHKIIGTSFQPRKTKIGNQALENWLATQLNPRIDFEIFEFNYQEFSVVIFRIDATKHTPISFKGVEYIRIGSYKKKLKDHPEKERKIWQLTDEGIFEKGIAFKNIAEDRVLTLLDFPAYFELMKIKLPANKDSILKKLSEENLVIKQDNKYHITNLGAILFAKDLSTFDKLARKAVRVIIYHGKDRLRTIKEQVSKKGYACGFEGLINYINDQLPTNEEIGKAFRKEVKMYPELAIRELVANALIHQDFSSTGSSPMVEIFNDRIEISNPGKPLINTLRFIDYSPQSRNETLASFMRRINVCEERGSGIDKVISSVEFFQLPAPNFIEDKDFLKVIMYSYRSLREMDRQDKARACYQHCVLKYVSGDYMTNQTLRARFDIQKKNYSIASRIMSDTIEAQLIKDYDSESQSKRYARYIPFWA